MAATSATDSRAGKGVRLVAIAPNGPQAVGPSALNYTDLDDSFESMKIRAASRHFNFDYLYDGDTQSVARTFGPKVTPHIFIFDEKRNFRFEGRIDDRMQEAKPNLVGYQLVWFCTVMSAGRGWVWLGPLAFAVFATWQLAISRHGVADLKLIALGVLLGALIDGTMALTGWSVYSAPAPALPGGGAPIWILTLWASFALTLNESFSYLQKRLWLAAMLGAVGGPAAYLGAWRGWHAVTLIEPTWRGLTALAVGWSVALPLMAGLARRWSRPMNEASLNLQTRAP